MTPKNKLIVSLISQYRLLFLGAVFLLLVGAGIFAYAISQANAISAEKTQLSILTRSWSASDNILYVLSSLSTGDSAQWDEEFSLESQQMITEVRDLIEEGEQAIKNLRFGHSGLGVRSMEAEYEVLFSDMSGYWITYQELIHSLADYAELILVNHSRMRQLDLELHNLSNLVLELYAMTEASPRRFSRAYLVSVAKLEQQTKKLVDTAEELAELPGHSYREDSYLNLESILAEIAQIEKVAKNLLKGNSRLALESAPNISVGKILSRYLEGISSVNVIMGQEPVVRIFEDRFSHLAQWLDASKSTHMSGMLRTREFYFDLTARKNDSDSYTLIGGFLLVISALGLGLGLCRILFRWGKSNLLQPSLTQKSHTHALEALNEIVNRLKESAPELERLRDDNYQEFTDDLGEFVETKLHFIQDLIKDSEDIQVDDYQKINDLGEGATVLKEQLMQRRQHYSDASTQIANLTESLEKSSNEVAQIHTLVDENSKLLIGGAQKIKTIDQHLRLCQAIFNKPSFGFSNLSEDASTLSSQIKNISEYSNRIHTLALNFAIKWGDIFHNPPQLTPDDTQWGRVDSSREFLAIADEIQRFASEINYFCEISLGKVDVLHQSIVGYHSHTTTLRSEVSVVFAQTQKLAESLRSALSSEQILTEKFQAYRADMAQEISINEKASKDINELDTCLHEEESYLAKLADMNSTTFKFFQSIETLLSRIRQYSDQQQVSNNVAGELEQLGLEKSPDADQDALEESDNSESSEQPNLSDPDLDHRVDSVLASTTGKNLADDAAEPQPQDLGLEATAHVSSEQAATNEPSVEVAEQEASPVEEAEQEASPAEAAEQEASPVEAEQEASPVEAEQETSTAEAPQEASPTEEAGQEASTAEAPQEASPTEEAEQEASSTEEAAQEASPVEEAEQEASSTEEAEQEASVEPSLEATAHVSPEQAATNEPSTETAQEASPVEAVEQEASFTEEAEQEASTAEAPQEASVEPSLEATAHVSPEQAATNDSSTEAVQEASPAEEAEQEASPAEAAEQEASPAEAPQETSPVEPSLEATAHVSPEQAATNEPSVEVAQEASPVEAAEQEASGEPSLEATAHVSPEQAATNEPSTETTQEVSPAEVVQEASVELEATAHVSPEQAATNDPASMGVSESDAESTADSASQQDLEDSLSDTSRLKAEDIYDLISPWITPVSLVADTSSEKAESSDSPATPESSDSPTTPESSDSPTTPESSDSPATPESSDSPTTPESSDSPATPESSDSPATPESSDSPATPEKSEKTD